ncbi:MAG: protein kinase [Phycisphaerae bacterium]|nr:protein kinase [Phycisphaerae bacterium]
MPDDEKARQADFRREQAVFMAAVEAATATDRQAVLDRECAGDAGLRQRVEALLAAHDAEGSLPTFATAPPKTSLPEALAGAVIGGRYKLLEEIGAGGMGVVWMAEQRSPVRRLVAVKLIKAGMDSRTVIARFEAERQALALMDHPNIARVFDGGVTEQGRPYFVMELVRGLPLMQYCDQSRMTIRDRLVVFTQICHAVQHAHQKGVLHRDIKPTNVLVTEHDGQPVPKVIDFGLAKALGGAGVLTEHTLHTAFGAMAGTPLYTAPEQVAINALDVDTRADIYALGVLLYELLTGTPPLERARFEKAAWDEVCRVIREEEPPKPSLRVSTSVILPNLAASRHIEPAKLSGLIKGDLDWIVLKALEKERSRRYDSATALAADIERHLNDEPVVAAPPSVGYRIRKFARKHRTGVLAGAGAVALLTLGLTATTWQWRRADANARTATRNQQLAETRKIEADRQRDAAELEAYIGNIALAIADMDRGNWAQARRSLSACPASKRAFEWQFLSQRAQGIAYSFPERFDLFRVSPDGKRVVTFPLWNSDSDSETRTCVIWDANGEPVSGIHEGSNCGAMFSPDGTLLLTWSDKGRAHLWDLNGKSIGPPIVYGEEVQDYGHGGYLTFGPTGNSILIDAYGRAANSRSTQLWSREGKPISTPIPTGWRPWVKPLSPDEKCFLVLERSNNTASVRIRDLSGKYVGSPMVVGLAKNADGSEPSATAAFSPDGKMILTSYNEQARLWTAAGLSVGKAMPDAASVEFTPDGRSVLAWKDRGPGYTACFYDLSGSPVGERMQERYGTWSQVFTQDSRRLLAWSQEGIVQWWDLAGRRVGEPIFLDSALGGVSLTRDERHMIGEGSQGVCLWDLDGRCEGQAPLSSLSPMDYGPFLPESMDSAGDFVIGYLGGGTAETRETSIAVCRLSHRASPVTAFAADQHPDEEVDALIADCGVAPSGTTLVTQTVASPGAGKEFSSTAPDSETVSVAHDPAITAAVVSPDHRRVVCAGNGCVRFQDAVSSRDLAILPVASRVTSLKFTKDGTRLILKFAEGGAEVWDTRGYEARKEYWGLRSRESQPAREYVKTLLSQPLTTREDLLRAIREDRTLPPLRKAIALRLADVEIKGIDDTAGRVLGSLMAERLSKSRVIAAVREEADSVVRARMLQLADRQDWPAITMNALQPIIDRDDQPKERYQAAAEDADEVLTMNPESTPSALPKAVILRRIGAAYYHVGRYEQSIELSRRAIDIKTEPNREMDAFALCRIAMAQFKLGQLEEARASLTSAAAAAQGTTNEYLLHLLVTATNLVSPPTTQPATQPVTATTHAG